MVEVELKLGKLRVACELKLGEWKFVKILPIPFSISNKTSRE